MPRRREVPRREILPDPLYSSVEVSKFVNVLMLDGKKAVAERMLYGALEQIKSRSGKDPLEVFGQALHNVRPVVIRSSKNTAFLPSTSPMTFMISTASARGRRLSTSASSPGLPNTQARMRSGMRGAAFIAGLRPPSPNGALY